MRVIGWVSSVGCEGGVWWGGKVGCEGGVGWGVVW